MRHDGVVGLDRSADDGAPAAGKVFGVGLARTGTTSLHLAMGELGLRSAPDSVALLNAIDRSFLDRYDAFFDNPIPFRYQELDEACPGSRYIVTHRPVDSWLRSMEWLFGPGLDRLDPATRRIGDEVHRVVYGIDRFDRDRLRAVHIDHYAAIADWVREKPHVWIELEDGLSWEPICDLLGRPVPEVPFPRANEAIAVSGRRRRWMRRGRQR